MPTELLAPGNAGAASSKVFVVNPAEGPRGISSVGLQGSETITVSRDRGDGTFRLLTDAGAILTVSVPESSIIASGRYRLERSAGSAGAYID